MIIPVLHRLANPTFFSLDRNFYRPDWAYRGYCLVWLDVRGRQAAEFIRRFLKHPAFDTQAKRMGTVARVHADGLLYWWVAESAPRSAAWLIK